jgi:hypothetical protein
VIDEDYNQDGGEEVLYHPQTQHLTETEIPADHDRNRGDDQVNNEVGRDDCDPGTPRCACNQVDGDGSRPSVQPRKCEKPGRANSRIARDQNQDGRKQREAKSGSRVDCGCPPREEHQFVEQAPFFGQKSRVGMLICDGNRGSRNVPPPEAVWCRRLCPTRVVCAAAHRLYYCVAIEAQKSS